MYFRNQNRLFQQHNSFCLVNHKLYWLDVSDKQRGLLIYINLIGLLEFYQVLIQLMIFK